MKLSRLPLVLLVVPLVGCPGTPPVGSQPDIEIPAPDFRLTERSGKTVTRDDLKGKVWVASFVFTRCAGPCPQVSATLARLQKELNLAGNPDLRLVTFTVDPDHDTPNELKEYAARYQADPERWLFLTGLPEKELHTLVQDGFKLSARPRASARAGEEFDHSSRLAVVDKNGVIRGYFAGVRPEKSETPEADFEENLRRLKDKVAGLLRE